MDVSIDTVNERFWTLDGDAPARTIARQGFVRLAPAQLLVGAGIGAADLGRWSSSWDRLPPDRWLRDGGRYRRRRHSCFVQQLASGELAQVPHRAHWQSVDYNALHGGIERMFEPIEAGICADPAWRRMLGAFGSLFAQAAQAGRAGKAGQPSSAAQAARWFIEAHQFRIDTSDGLGRPTPEGAHRDGVDFVAVILIDRRDVRGGETRVFDADGPQGIRFVMEEPWSAVLLDDQRVIHETTPIQPDGPNPHRDTLVLTYRRGGFQAPGAD